MSGTYTEIIFIICPSSASPGSRVDVTARVKNLYTTPIYLSCSAKYNDTIFYLFPEYLTASPGTVYSFEGSFIMPNNDVRVHIWSFFWTGTEWYQDDYAYKDISVSEVPLEPTFSGLEINFNKTAKV